MGPMRVSGPGTRGALWHPLRGTADLEEPLRWATPQLVHVVTDPDLFSAEVPLEQVVAVLAVIAACPHHTFQLQTTEPSRLRTLLTSLEVEWLVATVAAEHPEWGPLGTWPPPDLQVGVVVHDQADADAGVPPLLRTPCGRRFVVADLRGPVSLLPYLPSGWPAPWAHDRGRVSSPRLDWVVLPASPAPWGPWVDRLGQECAAAGVALRDERDAR